ncbi:MAG: TlpA family protein disulfide reductase [Fibrobacter sp.]|nr:TlpA family protein disulfide reductase [Fibrobacter sp.]
MRKSLFSKKTTAIFGVLSILAPLLLCACGQESFQTIPAKISNFKGKIVDGGTSTYEQHKGLATLIVLTASWCPTCRAEIPQLHNLSSDFYNRGFRIIMISEDNTPFTAAKYKKDAQIPWSTFHWNYEIMNVLGNPGVIPVSYLINAKDSIIKVNVGVFDEQEMRVLIEDNLPKN